MENINNNLDKKNLNEIETKKLFQSLSNLDFNSLDLQQKEIIIKSVGLKKLQKQAKIEYDKLNFDLDSNLDLFLKQYQSKQTKTQYKAKLKIFFQWIQQKNLSVIELDSKIAYEFVSVINSLDKSNNYKNSIISIVSSFYSFLSILDVVEKNYFLKIKSKPKQNRYNKTIENLPTKQDLEVLFNQIDNLINSDKKRVSNGAKKVLVSVKILLNNGLRIGSLDKFVLNKDGSFSTTSKGKITKGKLDTESKNLLKSLFDFEFGSFKEIKLNSNSLLNFFKKYNFSFSSHSFRHLFSIREYQKNKDIHRLSKLLNHSNIGITGTYLSSLNIDIENKEVNNFDVSEFSEIETSLKKIKKTETIQKENRKKKVKDIQKEKRKKLEYESLKKLLGL